MIIVIKEKIVFIDVPKTGSRSIRTALRDNFKVNTNWKHQYDMPLPYKNYFTFIVKRNPYDRVCSAYWHACMTGHPLPVGRTTYKQGLTLEEFLLLPDRGPILGITQAIYHKNNRIDQILDFEHLERDFNTLPFIHSPIKLQRLNYFEEYPRPHWLELTNKKTRQMISDIYAEDFELLGFDK